MEGTARATNGTAAAAGAELSTRFAGVVAGVVAIGVGPVAVLELVASDGLPAVGSGGGAVAVGVLVAEIPVEAAVGWDAIGGHGLITTVTGETGAGAAGTADADAAGVGAAIGACAALLEPPAGGAVAFDGDAGAGAEVVIGGVGAAPAAGGASVVTAGGSGAGLPSESDGFVSQTGSGYGRMFAPNSELMRPLAVGA